MKRRYILIVTAFAFSLMVSLSGCSEKAAGESKVIVASKDDNINKNEETNGAFEKINLEKEYGNEDKIVQSGYENIEQYLDEEAANKGFQGVALVAKGDEIKFAKAYGYADYDEKRENKLTTRFAIASNTKQFTAAAIMQLAEKNKLSLDDRIYKYFPDYQYGSIITIRELLQMRSGIPDYLNEVEVFMKSDDSLDILKDYKDNVYCDKYVEDNRWNSDVILNSLYLNGLYFEPNTAYDYCNTNYYLLGLIIEKASGLSYEDYIKENIFKVSKMATSSMEAEELDAKGHGSTESGEIIVNPDFTYAAGNIYANVYDMFRWNRALHTGKIVSNKSYKEMITPVDGYGYGLFINEGIIRHSGVIDGFNSNTEYDVNNDLTIIVMENSDQTTDLLDAKYDTSIIHSLLMNKDVADCE